MRFRKKPVEVEAIRWTGDNLAEIAQLAPERAWGAHEGQLYIDTLEGTMRASPGAWIIRGVQGEVYPCKPEIFEATYEAVEG